MVNVVLDFKCEIIKYMFETINYNKVGRKYKINLFFDKKSLEFGEVLFVVHNLLNTTVNN